MREASTRSGLDWDAIRREAEAAANDFFENHWESYLARVERVEALPENRSGTDKSWVERAAAIHRAHCRGAVRIS